MVLTFVFFCCFVVWFLGVLDLKELPAGEWAGRSADASADARVGSLCAMLNCWLFF
jgi:hypothetical protein